MSKIPFRISPMLATLVDEPFTKKNWVFEEKYDGVRMLAYKETRKISLISRNEIDRTTRYPQITVELAKLDADTLILDGEIVVFDNHGISQFQLLQQSKGNVRYAVFDCLYRNGRDLRREPLSVRRKILEETLGSGRVVQIAKRLARNGIVAFAQARNKRLEGIIAKDSASFYAGGRSQAWLKVKVHQNEEFVVGGFTAAGGSRQYFGALLLGEFHGKALRYVGKVGTGFNESMLGYLYRKMKPIVQRASPFVSDVRERTATFVDPELVAQIAFTERTKDGKLRHPVYLGLRDDKPSREVQRGASHGHQGKTRRARSV